MLTRFEPAFSDDAVPLPKFESTANRTSSDRGAS
jgi:hypothetical protein